MNRAGPPEMENPRLATEGLVRSFRPTHTSRAPELQAWPFRCSRIVWVRYCLPPSEWDWLRQAAITARFFAEWRRS